jgi:hypothetical protein
MMKTLILALTAFAVTTSGLLTSSIVAEAARKCPAGKVLVDGKCVKPPRGS